jgi:hypothetical protein
MIELNPLDILNVRRLSYIPQHFAQTQTAELMFADQSIDDWIQNRLKGRYAITTKPTVDKDGKLKSATFVAFEDQKELTYFMLACPHLRRN